MKKLRGRLELTYEGEGDNLTAIAHAYVVMQSAQRTMTKLGFTGWRLIEVKVRTASKRKVKR